MLFETERLIITEFTPDMAEDVYNNSLDEDTRRFVPDEVYESVDDAKEVLEFLIEQYESEDGPYVYPLITKDFNENIGYVQLVMLDDGIWECGYHIAKMHTNKGYATEAMKAFLPYIAEKLGLKEIYGICLIENLASIKVMHKCGFETVFSGIEKYQGEEREILKGIWTV